MAGNENVAGLIASDVFYGQSAIQTVMFGAQRHRDRAICSQENGGCCRKYFYSHSIDAASRMTTQKIQRWHAVCLGHKRIVPPL
jgi:hypothetical protein